MIWTGEYFKCKLCGEIYPYRAPLCPCCGGICERVGSFVREDFSDWQPGATSGGTGLPGEPLKPQGRVARWAQKLLDLSLGNRLLNLKDSKKVIPLLCPNIGVLEDKIAANEVVTIQSLSGLLGEAKYNDYLRGKLKYNPADFNVNLEKELGKRRLWTRLTPAETEKRLKELYRLARLDLEESGVNTLFLGLGFVEWKLSVSDEHTYRSPILLVPVRFERRSIADGIRMTRLDDDTVLNATLIELLRCQFGIAVSGVDPLPIDASGVDVPQIMDRFRDAIAGLPGWSVVEEALVGQFSFGKFVMWKDLTTRIEDFKKSKLVNHLIDGGGIFDDGVEVFPPEEVSRHIDYNKLYCPMSADSSQLAAVLYSAQGKSFVLHGPPGTGKSQTITNIIAHNLAIGRKVLFVSEKKAALDVVYKRLSSIGLAPFCLELHSNKSGKQDVLAQFSDALKATEISEPKDWNSVISGLEGVRDDLNAYISALHHNYPNGKSAYDCLCSLMGKGASSFDRCIEFRCVAQSKDEYLELQRKIANLANEAALVKMSSFVKLTPVKDAMWSPSFEREIGETTGTLRNAADRVRKAFLAVAGEIALDTDDVRFGILDRVAKLLRRVCESGYVPRELMTEGVGADGDFLLKFSALAKKRSDIIQELDPYRQERLLEVDVKSVQRRIDENRQSFFIVRFFRNNAIVKELAEIKKMGSGSLKLDELISLLPKITKYQSLDAEYHKDETRASVLLGGMWNDGNPEWDSLPDVISKAQANVAAVGEAVPESFSQRLRCLERLQGVVSDYDHAFAPETELAKAVVEFQDAWYAFRQQADELAHYVGFDLSDYDLTNFTQLLDDLLSAIPDLRAVFRYRDARRDAVAGGLGGFAVAVEGGAIVPQTLPEEFELAYSTKMLNDVLVEQSSLSSFTGVRQEDRIKKFRELDQEYTRLCSRMVYAKVAAGLPRRRSGSVLAKTAPLGILRHECEKKARHKPVRQLLGEIGSLAGMLKPCFLMSPLSVAQYLPANTSQFDLIVFDEASQIPVWDAVGVIARANQVIVVGDPKQMPPTNFFQKGDNGVDVDIEGVEDLESILDECIAAGVHSTHLNWHYRSRHESLISFSNHNYYEDRLLTFPAASESPNLGVRFAYVADGVYDRKASRTNVNEATALVDYIFSVARDPEQRKRSMGVVTFSEAQKQLIEDIVEKRREKDHSLEEFFSDQGDEPFFVKNLENVQGDERDVVLFSVCYAPDSDGKFTMNFGPLNRTGGERRLNVAITRAKEQVVIFSSIRASQIDLNRTESVGVSHLKDFIDYAEKGAHVEVRTGTAPLCDSFAGMVTVFLEKKGYKVEHDIGLSDRKIDIAVRNPQNESEFLLGIECDGPSYAAPRTARDRDSLRGAVLRSLGWRICNVWSVDWAFDRSRAEERLLAVLKETQEAPREVATENLVTEPTDFFKAISEEDKVKREDVVYEVWSPRMIFLSPYFYSSGTEVRIQQQMLEVLDLEAPICEGLLFKRIAKAWDVRMTENAREWLARCVRVLSASGVSTTKFGDERVYWAPGRLAESFTGFRVPRPGDDDTKRAIGEIPPEEVANAIRSVRHDIGESDTDLLYRETLKLFGMGVVTSKARRYLDVAMSLV